jgi:hypothetical protein
MILHDMNPQVSTGSAVFDPPPPRARRECTLMMPGHVRAACEPHHKARQKVRSSAPLHQGASGLDLLKAWPSADRCAPTDPS